MSIPDRLRTQKWPLLIGLIVVLAYCLRFRPIAWYFDESIYVMMASDLIRSGSFVITDGLMSEVAESLHLSQSDLNIFAPMGYYSFGVDKCYSLVGIGFSLLLAFALLVCGRWGLYLLPVSGALCVVILYFFAHETLPVDHDREAGSFAASVLLAANPLHVLYSYFVYSDIPSELFVLVGVYSFLKALKAPEGKPMLMRMIVSGILVGYSMNIRYTNVFALGALTLFWLARGVHLRFGKFWFRQAVVPIAAFLVAALFAFSLTIVYHIFLFGSLWSNWTLGYLSLGYQNIFDPAHLPEMLVAYGKGIAVSFTPVGLILVLVGFYEFFRFYKSLALFFATWIISLTLFQSTFFFLDLRYLLSYYPALVVMEAYGLMRVVAVIGARLHSCRFGKSGSRMLLPVLAIIMMVNAAPLVQYNPYKTLLTSIPSDTEAVCLDIAAHVPSDGIILSFYYSGYLRIYGARYTLSVYSVPEHVVANVAEYLLRHGYQLYFLYDWPEIQVPSLMSSNLLDILRTKFVLSFVWRSSFPIHPIDIYFRLYEVKLAK